MTPLFLTVSLALTLPPSVSTSQAPLEATEVARTWVWPGTSFGPRFGDGGVGLGSLGVSYRLTEWLEPEAFLGMGAHASLEAPYGLQVIDRFSFGTRIVLPIDEARPFVWLALHHEHQATLDAMVNNPIGSTLGVSTDGVAHYTGGEAGIGISLPVNVDDNIFQTLLRVNVVYLPALGGHVVDVAMQDQVAIVVDLAAGLPLHF